MSTVLDPEKSCFRFSITWLIGFTVYFSIYIVAWKKVIHSHDPQVTRSEKSNAQTTKKMIRPQSPSWHLYHWVPWFTRWLKCLRLGKQAIFMDITKSKMDYLDPSKSIYRSIIFDTISLEHFWNKRNHGMLFSGNNLIPRNFQSQAAVVEEPMEAKLRWFLADFLPKKPHFWSGWPRVFIFLVTFSTHHSFCYILESTVYQMLFVVCKTCWKSFWGITNRVEDNE